MIDHVSLGVRSLERATPFYEAVLGALDYRKMVERPATVGFGRQYPCLWLNLRPGIGSHADSGWHVALRARSQDQVDAFHSAALVHGGGDGGAPGWRHYSSARVYAAFVLDEDGNRIEAMFIAETAA
jgi:catechol 2,3-dioxygenase-like lactoylglutathione lyase family enzyme